MLHRRSKRVKTKNQNVLELIPTFVEVTGEKMVRGGIGSSWIGLKERKALGVQLQIFNFKRVFLRKLLSVNNFQKFYICISVPAKNSNSNILRI